MALEIFRLVGSIFVDSDAANKSLQKTDKHAEGIGTRLLHATKAAGKFALGVVGAATAAGTALVAVAENTREYRTEQGKLKTAFQQANFVAEDAKKTYQALNGILGDSGQAVEAANHLAKLATSQEDLSKWTNICTGVYGTFGDSLPIENLTEASNETAKTGALTGGLADALNWAGVNEDKFQKSLDACSSEQERQALITDTLNGLYSDAAQTYREVNSEVIAANTAHDKLNNALAVMAGSIEPIVSQGKNLIAEVLLKATPYVESLASVVIPWLVGAISGLINWIDIAITSAHNFLTWLREMGDYASGALNPIISDLSSVIGKIQEKLNPVISALAEYITSGEAAEDITNFLKSAIDLLANAYQAVCDAVSTAIIYLQQLPGWVKENEQALTLIGIAIGTLTTAIIAYNVAQAVKHAGGMAEIAQLAILQVQLWGLAAAESAHAVVSGFATAATTAFGTAVNFLTSPITLVIAAIGALIAVVYLLVRNWDTVKATALAALEYIKNAWGQVSAWFMEHVVSPIDQFFKGLWGNIQATFSNVRNWFTNIFTGAVNGVKSAWSGIESWFKSLLDKVKSVFTTVASAIGNVFKHPINTIIRGINVFIGGLNKIKIPDWVPAVGGKGFNFSRIPYLESGGILERGQVGFLEGNGAEAVVPLEKNKKWTRAVAEDMDEAMGGSNGQVLAVLMDILDALIAIAKMGITLDTGALVGGLARPMDRKLGQIQAQKERK